MPKSPEEWHCFHCGTGGNTGGFCVMCGGGSRDFVKRDKEYCRKCGLAKAEVPTFANFCPRCGVGQPLSGEYAFAVHDAMSRAGVSETEVVDLILRQAKAAA
jgi:hypothetical protein